MWRGVKSAWSGIGLAARAAWRALWMPPLFRAATRGTAADLRRLVAQGAAVHVRRSDGQTPLHRAVMWNGDAPEVIAALLSAGADVNARANSGETVLAASMARPQLSVVRLLLSAGADVTIRDSVGDTVLKNAVSRGVIVLT